MPASLLFADPPAARAPVRALSGIEKAAIVVRVLAAEGAELPLRDLPEQDQHRLVLQLGRMGRVDAATMDAVVAEFCGDVEGIGVTFPPGLPGALELLGEHLSEPVMRRIREAIGTGRGSDPWRDLAAAATDRLLPALAEESVEVAAIVLAKLPVPRAAELIGRMPGPRARAVAHALSLTAATPPDVVERIGRALAARIAEEPPRAFETGPAQRVGAILNFSPAATRDDVLDGLTEADAGFAAEVRKAIFTFANIPARIDPRDVPKVLRAVEQPVLIRALAGAKGPEAASAEFILANISQRMAQSLRDEMASLGKVSPREAEAAMTEVVVAIRRMEEAGELSFVAEDEDEEVD
ncbi:MAG: flagellar motor switch protein FliG [Rhodobacteraceae bacterium]|nr:flagellar motor switch protein FliG [Paracoccaceae bacterium]